MRTICALALASVFVAAEEPAPETGDWHQSLQTARAEASKKNGYAVILLIGDDAGSLRMAQEVLTNPKVEEALRDAFACVRGTREELDKDDQAKSKLRDAGAGESPAMVVVDPDDGAVVDVTKGELGLWQFLEVLKDIVSNRSQKALEERVKKEPELQLALGDARLRRKDLEGAASAFEIAAKSDDKVAAAQARLGLARIALEAKDWKKTDKLVADAVASLPEEAPDAAYFGDSPRALALYLGARSKFAQDLREDASKDGKTLLEKFPMSTWAKKLYDWGQEIGWNWIEAREIPK